MYGLYTNQQNCIFYVKIEFFSLVTLSDELEFEINE